MCYCEFQCPCPESWNCRLNGCTAMPVSRSGTVDRSIGRRHELMGIQYGATPTEVEEKVLAYIRRHFDVPADFDQTWHGPKSGLSNEQRIVQRIIQRTIATCTCVALR